VHRDALLSHDYFGLFWNVREERDAWLDLQAELLPQWIAAHPRTRPRCWWLYSAVEPRRRLDGIPAADDPRRAPGRPENFMGLPRLRTTAADIDQEYETQVDYLRRLDLLTASETQAL
jgi:hypothetical protein